MPPLAAGAFFVFVGMFFKPMPRGPQALCFVFQECLVKPMPRRPQAGAFFVRYMRLWTNMLVFSISRIFTFLSSPCRDAAGHFFALVTAFLCQNAFFSICLLEMWEEPSHFLRSFQIRDRPKYEDRPQYADAGIKQ